MSLDSIVLRDVKRGILSGFGTGLSLGILASFVAEPEIAAAIVQKTQEVVQSDLLDLYKQQLEDPTLSEYVRTGLGLLSITPAGAAVGTGVGLAVGFASGLAKKLGYEKKTKTVKSNRFSRRMRITREEVKFTVDGLPSPHSEYLASVYVCADLISQLPSMPERSIIRSSLESFAAKEMESDLFTIDTEDLKERVNLIGRVTDYAFSQDTYTLFDRLEVCNYLGDVFGTLSLISSLSFVYSNTQSFPVSIAAGFASAAVGFVGGTYVESTFDQIFSSKLSEYKQGEKELFDRFNEEVNHTSSLYDG